MQRISRILKENEKSLSYSQAIAILSHINPVHTISSYLFQINFNIILPFSHNVLGPMYQSTRFFLSEQHTSST